MWSVASVVRFSEFPVSDESASGLSAELSKSLRHSKRQMPFLEDLRQSAFPSQILVSRDFCNARKHRIHGLELVFSCLPREEEKKQN